VANGRATIANPHPAIDIFNFHYASPPDTVAANYHWNKPIGDNETGFQGTGNLVYRREAWEFLLAGGALFNHLDYSFVVGREDGTFQYPTNTPGGGNPELRRQLKSLAQFIRHFDLPQLKPDRSLVRTVQPAQVRFQALSESGRQYGIYLAGSTQAVLQLALPAGRYRLEWLNPVTGAVTDRERLNHQGGVTSLTSPVYREDIALRLRR
jgi:hypothetical protein